MNEAYKSDLTHMRIYAIASAYMRSQLAVVFLQFMQRKINTYMYVNKSSLRGIYATSFSSFLTAV